PPTSVPMGPNRLPTAAPARAPAVPPAATPTGCEPGAPVMGSRLASGVCRSFMPVFLFVGRSSDYSARLVWTVCTRCAGRDNKHGRHKKNTGQSGRCHGCRAPRAPSVRIHPVLDGFVRSGCVAVPARCVRVVSRAARTADKEEGEGGCREACGLNAIAHVGALSCFGERDSGGRSIHAM